MSGIEFDVMLRAQELRLQSKLDHVDKNNELRVKAQSVTFNGGLKELKAVAREHHVLFIQDVKTIREDVNRKIEELQSGMEKEIKDLTHNYCSILTKVDIIIGAVTKIAECYNSMLPKIDAKYEIDLKNFGKIDSLLVELKEMVSNPSSSYLFTPEFLTQKFRLLESTIHLELAPLSKLLNLLRTDAPPVATGVQGGERKNVVL